MNRRRGKAITGDFKNEVLHFGKLLSKQEGLIFFSAKIGDNTTPQCIAVVLDSYFPRQDMTMSVGEYATKVNTISEQDDFISPIIELGMAPDNKPFFISNEYVKNPLNSYTFQDRSSLRLFFTRFWKAYRKLEGEGIDVTYIDTRNIDVEANHPLLFPAVRSLIGGDLIEEYFGSLDQSSSFRIFKSVLANSLFWNRHIFSDNEQLEEQLLDLGENEIEAFLDALDLIKEEGAFENTLNLNSFEEIEDFPESSEVGEMQRMGEFKEDVEEFRKEASDVTQEPQIDSYSESRFELEDSSEENTKFARSKKIGRLVWEKAKPILLRMASGLVAFFLSLPRKVQIGLSIALILILFLLFGGSHANKAQMLENDIKQSRSVHSGSEPTSDKIVEVKATKESSKEMKPLKLSSNNPPPQKFVEKAEAEVNTTNDKADGMRSQETIDDLAAIQSIKGLLKESQIKVLIQLSKSDDFEVRIASIRTLGEKAPKGNLEVQASLLESMSDPDYLVRGFAIGSITAYMEADSVPILEAQREKEESEIVIAAIDRAVKRLETYKKRR